MNKIEKLYKSIGEFVIVFQWVENMYREIGWFILDPERKNWPPKELRKETNEQLINKVTGLYLDLIKMYDFPDGTKKAKEFLKLGVKFHKLRKLRNKLIHSAYIQMKAGGEVLGYIRSDVRMRLDNETGEMVCDRGVITETTIRKIIKGYARSMFRLGLCNAQLIHWYPFSRFIKVRE